MKIIKIEIIGSSKCKMYNRLKSNLMACIKKHNCLSKIIEINDFEEILKCNVTAIPALIINDKVVAAGGVITKNQIAEFI